MQYKKVVTEHYYPKTEGEINDSSRKAMDSPQDFHWNGQKKKQNRPVEENFP